MPSELISDKEYNDMTVISFLESIILDLGSPVSKDNFIEELKKYDKGKINKLNVFFCNYIKNITHEKINRCKTHIVTKVNKINANGTVNVVGVFDTDFENNWTEIPNPTIFRYLEKGDEVILGCTRREQKSNCWVEFANIPPEQFIEKTILKDIFKIFDINDNVELLKKWTKTIKSHL